MTPPADPTAAATEDVPPRVPLHPTLAGLVAAHGVTRVTGDTVDDWEAEPGTTALLFPGDPAPTPDGLAMAAALPRLQAAFHHRFRVGLVPPADQAALARRYDLPPRPCVLFLRDGGRLGTVSGRPDWPAVVEAVGDVLALAAAPRPPAAPPGRVPPPGG